jgi:serine/threonine protein kinase
MAPEQITYGMFDIKVDMWAIGVILYQVALKLTAIPVCYYK